MTPSGVWKLEVGRVCSPTTRTRVHRALKKLGAETAPEIPSGEAIRQKREAQGLTRAELARLKRKLNTTADRIAMVGVPGIIDDPVELIEYWRAS